MKSIPCLPPASVFRHKEYPTLIKNKESYPNVAAYNMLGKQSHYSTSMKYKMLR